MGQELEIPDSFKNKPMSQAFAGLAGQGDSLSEGIGQSYAVIGYKGKVWSLRHRGERKVIIRPDDGTPSAHLDVIILGQAKGKSKSYYKAYDAGTSDGDRPICSSIDGIVPDADATTKQCDSCALCPRNVWKTDPQTGRKGRECTDYKRLAVLILPTQTSLIMGGVPLMEAAFLRVPPDSLNSLAIMGDTMDGQGHHYSSFITRITFDPNKAHPCMVFRPIQSLSDQEAPVILEMRNDASVGRITGGDVALGAMKAVAQALAPPSTNVTGLVAPATTATAAAPATPQPQPVQQTTVQPAPSSLGAGIVAAAAQPSPATGLASGLTGTVVAPPVTPTPDTNASPSAETGRVNTGFGGANIVSDIVVPQTGVAGLTAADVGEPEASDEELDARIASLINRG